MKIRLLILIQVGLLSVHSFAIDGTVTSNSSVEEVSGENPFACLPESPKNPVYHCFKGLFNSAIDVVSLPYKLVKLISIREEEMNQCNRNPEMKLGMIAVIEPMIRDDIQSWLSLGCRQLQEKVRQEEYRISKRVNAKLWSYKNWLGDLNDPRAVGKVRENIVTMIKNLEPTDEEWEFYERREARDETKRRIQQMAGQKMRNRLGKAWTCADLKDVVEGACYGVGVVATGGLLAITGRGIVRGVTNTTSRSVKHITPTLRQRFLELGLNHTQINRLGRSLSRTELSEVGRLLSLSNNGTPLNLNQAARLGELTNKARVRGQVAFHRTTEAGIAGMQADAAVRGVAFNRRIFAFPVHETGSGVTTAYKLLGNQLVQFQGQAAKLFSDRVPLGVSSGLQRRAGHQVTPAGDLVILESKMVDGVLVVTKAEMRNLSGSSAVTGRTMDILETFTSSGLGYILVDGIGRIRLRNSED